MAKHFFAGKDPLSPENRLAGKVTVTRNEQLDGIELQFDGKPHADLQIKLRALEFRPGKVPMLWYARFSDQRLQFAVRLKAVIGQLPAGPDADLFPSFEPELANIEKKEFSLVTITLQDGQIKNYVLFEPSKLRAEAIMLEHVKYAYPEGVKAVVVKPRTFIKEARILFQEGKFIKTNIEKRGVMKRALAQKWWSEKVVREGKQVSRPDLDLWLKGYFPELGTKDADIIWSFHTHAHPGSSSTLHPSKVLSVYHTIYKKLHKIIPDLTELLKTGATAGKSELHSPGLMDLHFDNLGKDKNGNYIIALAHYFEQGGDQVPDPDMQIRVIPDMEAAEAMTYQDQFKYQEVYPEMEGKEMVNLRLKKDLNHFLNQWLSNILAQGHRINLSKSGEDDQLKDHEPAEFQEEFSEAENKGIESGNAVTADVKYEDVLVPGVLIPEGITEPLSSHVFRMYDMQAIIDNDFAHLKKYTKSNIQQASALEMFELLQLVDFYQYLSISKKEIIQEWERRGEQLFEQLGYPTDSDYPYVSLHRGYVNVEAGKELFYIDDNGWWYTAMKYRPVASPEKALGYIDSLIEKYQREIASNDISIYSKEASEKIPKLKQSREVILNYLNKEEQIVAPLKSDPARSSSDPLANVHGGYTAETAGENFEKIVIPMPIQAKYEAEISIVKTSNGEYKTGLGRSKKFGDYNGSSYSPGINDTSYPSRHAALEDALKWHENELIYLIKTRDDILGNEAGKLKHLNAAMKALREFAAANDIDLNEKMQVLKMPDPASPTNIKELQRAYWTEADNTHPVDKIIIEGADFHQARLRDLILDKIESLPIDDQLAIADQLKQRFRERRGLDQYEKGEVSIGKKEDEHKAALIRAYLDDMILDNDIWNPGSTPGVLQMLVSMLFSDGETIVDIPAIKERSESKKKPSQHDLNKQIEALIDLKDQKGESCSAEEKVLLAQYAGSGGLTSQGATGKGILYEYYTPGEIVEKMWDLAYKFGYAGGRVLEPSVGTGRFLKHAPTGKTDVVGYETNHYAARIAQILYPDSRIIEAAFETIFFSGNIHLKDDHQAGRFSLVIGNPPYGEFSGKYAGMGEKAWTKATRYEEYFITRGLDLLGEGGLLIFIIPSSFTQGGPGKVKERIAAKSQVLDLYRLPNNMFKTTDIGTDILALKKTGA